MLIETRSASLMAAVSSPGCHCQPHKVYFAGTEEKKQKATAKGLVQAGAEHHQPGAFGVCCWALCPGITWHFVPPAPLSALAVPMLTNTSCTAHPHSFPCSLLEAAIMCKKEGEGKTSTARNHIILLQSCQETDCRSSCI